MTRILNTALLAAAVAVGACSKAEPIGKSRIEKGDLLEVGKFEFVERSGRTFSEKDLKGKVWIGALIFTTCNGPCPLMCAELARFQEDFRDSTDFRIVATTVDPATDTPEVLSKFGKQYSADPDRWYFLTGGAEAIRKFAVDGMRLAADPDKAGHSTEFVLVDRDGKIRDYFSRSDPEEMKRARALIRDLLAEKAP